MYLPDEEEYLEIKLENTEQIQKVEVSHLF
jgi:hypothetical protein